MKIIQQLLRQKSFYISLLMILSTLIVMRISNVDPATFNIYTSGILGYTLFPLCMFTWLSSFINFYESPSFRYRINTRYHEKSYFMAMMLICSLIYALIIGIMMFMLTGVWLHSSLIALSFKNLVCYLMIYSTATMIFNSAYFHYQKINKAFTLTFILLIVYTMFMFTNGYFIDILLTDLFFFKIILTFLILFCLLFFKEFINTSLLNITTSQLKYIGYGILIFLQIHDGSTDCLSSIISLDLNQIYELSSIDLYRYVLWLLPKLLILFDCASILTGYFEDNFKYFMIRSNENKWFALITKKVVSTISIYALIHLLIFILLIQKINFPISDWLMFVHLYFWEFLIFEIFALIRIISKSDKSIIGFILAYLCINLCILKVHASDIWYNIFLLQSFDFRVFFIEVLIIIGLHICSIKCLKRIKE